MTENVIYPDLFRRTRRPDPEEHRKALHNRDLMKLRNIERQLEAGRIEAAQSGKSKKGPVFVRLDDRIVAARANGRLIADAKSEGVSVEEIKEKFGGRIDRYSIFSPTGAPSRASSDRAKMKRKLMKRVDKYLRLADITAEMLGRNADDAKIEVLKDTTLWAGSEGAAVGGDVDERAWHLALLLNEMAQSVIRRERLMELFSRARRIPGVWDVHSARFRQNEMGSIARMTCLFEDCYEEWMAHWQEPPPLPSVPLVRLFHADVDAPLLVEKGGLDRPLPMESAFREYESFSGEERNARIRIFREIRLSLGPTTGPDRVGAMFESRALVKLILRDAPAETACPLIPSCDAWLIEGGGQVLLDGMWRRVRSKTPIFRGFEHNPYLQGPLYWDFTPLSDNALRGESYYFSWTPVRADYVRHWLDHPSETPLMLDEPLAATWYLPSSRACAVEHYLATGALEAALSADIATIRTALDEREQEWRSAAITATEDLVARWRDDTSANW